MEKHYYGMRLRGFSIGCQPMQGLIRRETSKTIKYYDILCYDRKLTEIECDEYSLDYIANYEEIWR